MIELTAERARELLDYDSETGWLTWRSARQGGVAKGSRAGCLHSRGYIHVGVDGRTYKAHRIIWLIVTGSWPSEQVDHINGVRNCNRWANLRVATPSRNSQNMRAPHIDNPTGFLGVSWDSGRNAFRADITTKGKRKYLGHFTDPAIAHQAYISAKRQLHASCTL